MASGTQDGFSNVFCIDQFFKLSVNAELNEAHRYTNAMFWRNRSTAQGAEAIFQNLYYW